MSNDVEETWNRFLGGFARINFDTKDVKKSEAFTSIRSLLQENKTNSKLIECGRLWIGKNQKDIAVFHQNLGRLNDLCMEDWDFQSDDILWEWTVASENACASLLLSSVQTGDAVAAAPSTSNIISLSSERSSELPSKMAEVGELRGGPSKVDVVVPAPLPPGPEPPNPKPQPSIKPTPIPSTIVIKSPEPLPFAKPKDKDKDKEFVLRFQQVAEPAIVPGDTLIRMARKRQALANIQESMVNDINRIADQFVPASRKLMLGILGQTLRRDVPLMRDDEFRVEAGPTVLLAKAAERFFPQEAGTVRIWLGSPASEYRIKGVAPILDRARFVKYEARHRVIELKASADTELSRLQPIAFESSSSSSSSLEPTSYKQTFLSGYYSNDDGSLLILIGRNLSFVWDKVLPVLGVHAE
jgi:hypothetical protein